ncbi:SigE family RNA polymerase sigma factor [Stackebrandtia nassauensis]|uniref:RNA polymerase, sigma-24 subunit, ECF subfamily n=1 Tax=Stackebrandtia nassauensis (strain DSM 44728 / CIP 108903 / NRRL B-16338 / NBRC 102104 / LLR-40K-21) TaxID=446470 RepID=D3Q6G8_STANL|nr:SigE family RNA polymerase sigma factor [Stackebrandtia nassauensis]ADD44211.1 RNA polymerase, sigma-24 subunit, ECF subfamily [Stackebrandtia nassauensis DSM 44728]
MRVRHDAEFQEYARSKLDSMRYFAYLSCGDWHRAEDAVQVAFVKLYAAWGRAARESLDAYTRRIVVNVLINEGRRFRFRREHLDDDPAVPVTWDGDDRSDDRMVLLQALSGLPRRQRITLVLRFWEDLSVEQTAAIMRCSPSTVKSQSVKGLAAMRDRLSGSFPTLPKGATA